MRKKEKSPIFEEKFMRNIINSRLDRLKCLGLLKQYEEMAIKFFGTKITDDLPKKTEERLVKEVKK